jgi:acetyltransferase-like isoleucine patch superfamily enzyme
VQVLGLLESTPKYPDVYFVHGIGTEHSFWKKAAIIAKTRIPLDPFDTIVHPTASISRVVATLGKGAVVLQQMTIANQARIGHHVIILPNSVISYDTVIGDYSCITGRCISGLVTMGHNCYLGTNSSIIGEVKIGHGCLIGMEWWSAQRPPELGDGWEFSQVPAQDARVYTACAL